MPNETVTYDGCAYTMLYQHAAGHVQWTTAYHLDDNRHVQLLRLTEDLNTGHIQPEMMSLHISDITQLMSAILLEETEVYAV
ncbi:hypothetical protein DFQ01_107128 [Paenibacillus cellulosilyticus]|uniref:Uncharacterized protein n=1 Tax=Paenibacillus cellulosilyticus TaxID=375489 RepID=A0A2V2YU66_9BACL|nr:hypothetical protein [Paenibacillus cellulosilyticus]PWW03231.1 hypothetical protein DFQ01_107128 [Paenibacillus cellulosilyticus]QKS43720.1 hypothetical protein HUB94_04170 [Paenibacillus cellulosilyticus]